MAWAEMFEDSGFEVYETSARLNIERHEDIEEPDRHMLQMREVLDTIKDKFYEVMEHTADWTAEERNPQKERWLGWLEKLTGLIRRQEVEEALQELKDEAATGGFWKRRRDENDD